MEFAEAVEFVRKLEGRALEYEVPEAHAKPKRRIEFSPQEYSDMSYAEALNLYGRVEKVIAGSAMLQKEIYGVQPEAARPEPEVPVVVAATAVPKREAAPPRAEVARPAAHVPAAPAHELEIEREEKKELEFEEKRPAEELEFEKPHEAPKERPMEIEIVPMEAPKPPEEEKKPAKRPGVAPEVSLRIPPVLMTSPTESAMDTVEKLEKQFGSEVKAGGKVNKEDAKKRMLELTRELFREKSVDRREEIKKEIVGLKSILTEAEGKARQKADIVSVVKNDQEYEVSSAKKAIGEAYEGALAPLLRFYDDEAALGRGAGAMPALEERAAKLREQVANLVGSYDAFLASKHSAELEELAGRGKGTKDMDALRAGLASTYASEFAALKNSIWSEIDSAISKRKGGTEEMGDEELLAYLQYEEPVDYQRYSRGEMTRVQALSEARKKIAGKRERK
ncbi:MAG: hypothetical protein NTY83_02950 [Candidatus Micrarchaeota archaeon]|nr:hypothetical protein [Candidatus Micrarchaeota archaeon]